MAQTASSLVQSMPEWQGSRPNRFHKGRSHNKPQDILDYTLSGPEISASSRKHFQPRHSSQVMNPYGALKVFPEKFQKSMIFDQVELKKLIHIPMNNPRLPDLEKFKQSNLSKIQQLQLGLKTNGIYRNFSEGQQHTLKKMWQGNTGHMKQVSGKFDSSKYSSSML